MLTAKGAGRPWDHRLDALLQALAPESGRDLGGATVHARKVGRSLEIRIEAETLRSMRAAVNSTLRWSGLALEVAERAAPKGEEE